ncbi:MAG: 2-C-methyl-D-erythritol 4-phosphate cytidylyltransferase [Solirubrobacterales bacterium]|jgi:2-C-methyl-D-erythritol 4-phosphate cytidylyltransferase|nr:2-C-methyl-D-erythritol 4-phosphate cytidylyltransferase [Solirubrobacterales bacterium]
MRAASSVSVVVVAAPAGYEQELERIAGEIAGRPDEAGAFHPIVVTGGDSRAASVGHALAEVPAQAQIVAVHDAARPLVTGALVDELVARLAAEPGVAGVIAAAPVADTLKRVGEGGEIAGTEDRSRLWGAQTPQVFRADVLRAAHDGDPASISAATDDASLVEAGGGRVIVHAVEAPNLKVTTPADLRVAEALLTPGRGDLPTQ